LAFTRPNLTTLVSRARSDIESRLTGAVASLRNSVESVLARVVAGATHGLHGHLVWLSRQLFPDTAEAEYMARWASNWNLERRPATQAQGSLDITGSPDGTVCPANTQWIDDNDIVYTQDAAGTIASGSATVQVTAVLGGTDGNQDVGAKLSLVAPVTGIDAEGTVSGTGITDGDDEETDAELQSRTLLRMANQPKGGGPGDYVNWALEVSGVTRAWEIADGDGPGTVVVYFVLDNKAGTIIPDASEIATVQAYLNGKAPITADVNVYAPTEVAVNFTIEVTPDTAAVRQAVEEELEDYILRAGDVDGVTLYISQMNEAISLASGETDHIMTVPAADVVLTVGQLPSMGTITWV
jgi:uncharacterized phage protein gp47/JayE